MDMTTVPKAQPQEPPEWSPHPNGKPHLWLNRDGVRLKYAPPNPQCPPGSPLKGTP